MRDRLSSRPPSEDLRPFFLFVVCFWSLLESKVPLLYTAITTFNFCMEVVSWSSFDYDSLFFFQDSALLAITRTNNVFLSQQAQQPSALHNPIMNRPGFPEALPPPKVMRDQVILPVSYLFPFPPLLLPLTSAITFSLQL